MKSYDVTIQMKTNEQYFPAVLFIMKYKVVQTLESVDETLWCDHLIETSLTELLQFIFCYCTKPNSTFWRNILL